ncbi:MAG: hypothetical protein CIT01_05610 [Methanobacterium sp. BRmetb2]|jgi:flagellar motor switch/type III secretory pathway protein FliN|nr:MAG: hypothetical protein CIT01_05610 [Methanobacterium sp. BRmetb2]
MLFSMAGVNAAEDDSSDGTIINDTNVTQEDNPLQSDDNDSTDNGTEDTGDQTDTITYQTSAEGSSGSVTVEEVETAASELKNYVEIHNSLPDTIQVGSYTLTMSEFLKILLMTVINLDQNVSTPVAVTEVGDAPNPAGQNISGNLLKSEYLQNAIGILNFIDSNGRAPNYFRTSLGNLRFEYIVFSYTKIMDFYGDYDRLPNYTKICLSDFMQSLTVDEIETASNCLKNYVQANKILPDTIQVGSKCLTMSEFLNVLLMAVINSDRNVSMPVAVTEVGDAPNPAGQNISGNIQKSEYVRKATNILNFMNSNDRAPNYSTTSLGNLRYEYIVFNFAKIMDFHKYYNRLPNYTVVQTSAMSYQMMEISSKYGAKNVIVTDSYVQCSGRCTCSLYQDYDYHTVKFVNYCPYCHKNSTLDYEEGNTIYDNPEGMWVCSMSKGGCDADFCLVHGKAHVTSGAKYLTSA